MKYDDRVIIEKDLKLKYNYMNGLYNILIES